MRAVFEQIAEQYEIEAEFTDDFIEDAFKATDTNANDQISEEEFAVLTSTILKRLMQVSGHYRQYKQARFEKETRELEAEESDSDTEPEAEGENEGEEPEEEEGAEEDEESLEGRRRRR